MEKKKIEEAAKALNASGLAAFKVKTVAIKEDALKEQFMSAVESVSQENEGNLPEIVGTTYNTLVDEEENITTNKLEIKEETKEDVKVELKETKEKSIKPVKTISKSKEVKEKVESRPAMLKRKIAANATLEDLLQDPELLEKYNNHKSWIKNDFNKINKG